MQRFDLFLNVRDFTHTLNDKAVANKVFSHLQITLPVHSRETQYVAYAGGRFTIQERRLKHVRVSDIVDRYWWLVDNAIRDNKINLKLWVKALLVVKAELVKEYRAYRAEGAKQ